MSLEIQIIPRLFCSGQQGLWERGFLIDRRPTPVAPSLHDDFFLCGKKRGKMDHLPSFAAKLPTRQGGGRGSRRFTHSTTYAVPNPILVQHPPPNMPSTSQPQLSAPNAAIPPRSPVLEATNLSTGANPLSRSPSSANATAVPAATRHPDADRLIAAAMANDLAKARELLSAGVPANVRGTDLRTPLMHACRLQLLSMAELLLHFGADQNLRNAFGYSPLATVATLGNPDLVQLLLSQSQSHPAAAKPDLDARTSEGMTPLLLAAQSGHFDIVRQLINAGADYEARGRDGRGVLHWAARAGNVDAVKWLLEKGCDVEIRNKDGYTPLHTAAALGDVALIKLLVDLGAQLETRNNAGHTPLLSCILMLASRPGNRDAVMWLAEKSNVDAEGEDGRTALHIACRYVNGIRAKRWAPTMILKGSIRAKWESRLDHIPTLPFPCLIKPPFEHKIGTNSSFPTLACIFLSSPTHTPTPAHLACLCTEWATSPSFKPF